MSGGKYDIFYAAKAQLGLDEDSYRAILVRITGKASLKEMSERQLLALIEEFRRMGFRPKKGGGAGKPLPASTKPYVRLIHALWKSCHRRGVIASGTRASLRSFVRERSSVDDPDFLTYQQASPIIEALKAMEARG